MLAKSERLTKKAFDTHFKSGRRLHGDLLQVIHSPAPGFNGAAVVGKKVFKKAVDRNRKRRQIYNTLYQLKKTNSLKGVFICIAKPAAATASYGSIKEELEGLISRTQKTKVE